MECLHYPFCDNLMSHCFSNYISNITEYSRILQPLSFPWYTESLHKLRWFLVIFILLHIHLIYKHLVFYNFYSTNATHYAVINNSSTLTHFPPAIQKLDLLYLGHFKPVTCVCMCMRERDRERERVLVTELLEEECMPLFSGRSWKAEPSACAAALAWSQPCRECSGQCLPSRSPQPGEVKVCFLCVRRS